MVSIVAPEIISGSRICGVDCECLLRSTVLRAKLPRLVRGEEVIKLVYDELEDRRTVFGFLDLNPAHKLFEYRDKVRAIHTSRLVRLLRMLYKYDCQGFLAFLRQQI